MTQMRFGLILLLGVQYGWPAAKDPKPPMEVTADIVSYYHHFEATSQADMVVRSEEDGHYFRVVYNYYHFGFDQPASKASQVIPPEMLHDGSIAWRLSIHLPRTSGELGPCRSVPQVGVRNSQGELVLGVQYAGVSNQTHGDAVDIEKLPCFVMERWTNLKTGASGPSRS